MIRKAYVDTVHGQMHYRYSTEGSGPPLVLFHMTASSSLAYEPLMSHLEGKFPLIAFDTMNYGESFRTDQTPTIDFIADGMLEALTNMGIDQFHSFGHHTGVSIQVEMAGKSPDRVLSVIMNGPNYANPEEMSYLVDTLATPNPISIKGTQLIFAWSRIKDIMALPLWEEVPHAAEVMNRETVDMLRAGPDWCWGYKAVFTHDLPAAMKKVDCPMFFVCGQKDPAYDFHKLALLDYPESPSYVNPDGGVYYCETHADDLAPHIARFVEDITRTNSRQGV